MSTLITICGLSRKIQPLLIERERFAWHQCNVAAKESGLECTCENKDGNRVLLGTGGRRWPTHVCCVAVTLNMTEYSNKTASNFVLSLNIPPGQVSDDSEGCSYGQLVVDSFIMTMYLLMHHISCRVFLVKHQITQVTQPRYSPDLAPCNFWLLPKLKPPLKEKIFQTIDEI